MVALVICNICIKANKSHTKTPKHHMHMHIKHMHTNYIHKHTHLHISDTLFFFFHMSPVIIIRKTSTGDWLKACIQG